MRILISNDDGYNKRGIEVLASILSKNNEVVIVAPLDEKSACSHSISLHTQVDIKKIKNVSGDYEMYSVSGTPADCIRVGHAIMNQKVDLVVSGINHGFNLAGDVIYSGTVSAAVEGSILGIPSVAFSMGPRFEEKNIEQITNYIKKIIETVSKEISKNKYNTNTVLNVNIPVTEKDEIQGIKICELGRIDYINTLNIDSNKDDNRVFIYGDEIDDNKEFNHEKDIYYIEKKYITISPVVYDWTNENELKRCKEIFKI